MTYYWDFGTGDSSTLMNPIYTFESTQGEATSFTVSLTVTDSLGSNHTSKIISLPK